MQRRPIKASLDKHVKLQSADMYFKQLNTFVPSAFIGLTNFLTKFKAMFIPDIQFSFYFLTKRKCFYGFTFEMNSSIKGQIVTTRHSLPMDFPIKAQDKLSSTFDLASKGDTFEDVPHKRFCQIILCDHDQNIFLKEEMPIAFLITPFYQNRYYPKLWNPNMREPAHRM